MLPPLHEIPYDEYDADCESDDLSDLGGAEGKAPIHLKQMESSLKQFAKGMGQPNFSTFNKWKKVWVAGFCEKKHWSSIWGQNRLKQLRDGPPALGDGGCRLFGDFRDLAGFGNF